MLNLMDSNTQLQRREDGVKDKYELGVFCVITHLEFSLDPQIYSYW